MFSLKEEGNAPLPLNGLVIQLCVQMIRGKPLISRRGETPRSPNIRSSWKLEPMGRQPWQLVRVCCCVGVSTLDPAPRMSVTV
ncbi:unnamed protein product [Boreogadus saida]